MSRLLTWEPSKGSHALPRRGSGGKAASARTRLAIGLALVLAMSSARGGADEPAKPAAVVVTWSATTGATFEDEFVGLMVNGGPCRFYGSRSIPEPATDWNSHTSLWIVYPTDGLHAGTNTFTLCGGGGGAFADSAVFHVIANTLTVRLSN